MIGITWSYRNNKGHAFRFAAREQKPMEAVNYEHGMISVPNAEGSCDRMSFNNRTGAMSYKGKMKCEGRPQPSR